MRLIVVKKERHKTVSKKRSRRSKQRESLSSLGATEEREHAYLGAMTSKMVNRLAETSDKSASEADDDMMTETATLVASSSVKPSSSSSSTSMDSEPPKEIFDNLLEKPEHRARTKESGISRDLFLEKVIKAPNKELGDIRYDLAKKRYQDREKEKVAVTVRANFSREKFKEQYEAERSYFDSVCTFLKRTYARQGRKETTLLDNIIIYEGKGSVRDLITTRTNKLSILTRLGAKPLNSDLKRALVLRALSAPLS